MELNNSLIQFTILTAVVAVVAGVSMFIYNAIQKRNQLMAVEKEYSTMRSQRDEIQYHIDWALSSNDRKEAAKLIVERKNLDKRLETIQRRYIDISDAKGKGTKQS
uniref:Uncharacterized protein n=1 Tax=Spongospora subterranea TaxID=70186 RepID=A0A0H5R4M3_9EUKA|eukprot:CRZ09145.1 hypothetical protein [Spongospora subterranea]